MPSFQAELLGKVAFFSGVLEIVLTTLKLYFFDKKGVPEMGTNRHLLDLYGKLLKTFSFWCVRASKFFFLSEISFLYKVPLARL